MSKVALCVIATNRYMEFVGPLLESADKHFLANQIQVTSIPGSPWLYTTQVDYHVFSNMYSPYLAGVERFMGGRNIIAHNIDHQPWPMMTLMRYHIMSKVDWSGYNYVYYIDADMRFVGYVGEEIFGDLVAVQHPGYYRGGGDWEDNKHSHAYVSKPFRKRYYAGGFQGGRQYPSYMPILNEYIYGDTSRGIMPKWHDESHWNALIAHQPTNIPTILSPSYCMPEPMEKRIAWGISHFEPKILALEKNHKEYRA